MGYEPTAQLVWHSTTSRVERSVILSEGCLSLSLRSEEITTVAVALAVADSTLSTAADSCQEMELGAHVARMRTFSSSVSATTSVRSPHSRALAPADELPCPDSSISIASLRGTLATVSALA